MFSIIISRIFIWNFIAYNFSKHIGSFFFFFLCRFPEVGLLQQANLRRKKRDKGERGFSPFLEQVYHVNRSKDIVDLFGQSIFLQEFISYFDVQFNLYYGPLQTYYHAALGVLDQSSKDSINLLSSSSGGLLTLMPFP